MKQGSLVAMLLLAATSATAVAQGSGRNQRDRIDTTFAFDRDGVVTLGNGSATIEVTGWDQPTIRIRARSDDGSLRMDATSKRVTVDPARWSDDVVIQVQVPRGVRVVARTNSGDIHVQGTRGRVDAQSGSGDVHVSDAGAVDASSLSGDVDIRQTTGAVTATSNNGEVTVTDAHGDIDITSVSGSLTITRAVGKVVHAQTTSGDIIYSGTVEASGRYDLSTHSGDIELSIPKDASAAVTLSTWNGSVDSDFPITLKPGFNTAGSNQTKHYNFTIGGGSAHITAESFNGDITISSRGSK